MKAPGQVQVSCRFMVRLRVSVRVRESVRIRLRVRVQSREATGTECLAVQHSTKTAELRAPGRMLVRLRLWVPRPPFSLG